MWAKRITTVCVILLTIALVAWPWILGKRPPLGSPKRAYLQYAARSSAYLGLIVMGLVGAGVGSFVIIRNERIRYREEARANLEHLIEAVQNDRQQKQALRNNSETGDS